MTNESNDNLIIARSAPFFAVISPAWLFAFAGHYTACPPRTLLLAQGGRFRRVRNLGKTIFRRNPPADEMPTTNPMIEPSSSVVLVPATDTTGMEQVVAGVAVMENEDNVNANKEEVTKNHDEASSTEMTTFFALSVEDSDLASRVDELFAQDNPQEALDLLLDNAAQVHETQDLYWRQVKCYYELFAATSNKDKAQQETYLREGIALAEQGLQDKFSDCGYLLKWKAIFLGKLGAFQPTKEKMQNSFVIRDALLQAQTRLPPEDASVDQALGEWCFKVAGISFVERQVASVLFGSPPTSTYEQALAHFQQSYAKKATEAVGTKNCRNTGKAQPQDPSQGMADQDGRKLLRDIRQRATSNEQRKNHGSSITS